ncbi:MAG: EamA family transporter, partial [Polyangiaceae bacterium]
VSTFLGLAAVLGAALGWALDSTITRPLADFDPRAVVFSKSIAGAALSTGIAFVLHDHWPGRDAAVGLIACGIVGYGLSLRLYLRAQRVLGAARTGTLFALAPFVGAAAAFAAGDREGAGLVATAGAIFAAGAYLQTTEDHSHRHRHEATEHEHLHRHDDGHHTHTHDPAVPGAHSHVHRHDATSHEHSHAADIHHRHGHDRH